MEKKIKQLLRESLLNFETHSYNKNDICVLLIEEKITKTEFFNFCNDILSESLENKSSLKAVVDKILKSLINLLKKASSFGLKIINSLNFILTNFLNLAKRVLKYYPESFDILKTTILAFAIMIITSSLTNAQSLNKKVDDITLKTAIGFLENQKKFEFYFIGNKEKAIKNIDLAIGELMKIQKQDGVVKNINVRDFGKIAHEYAKWGIEEAEKFVQMVKTKDSSVNLNHQEIIDLFIKYLEAGDNYIDYELKQSKKDIILFKK